MPAKGRVSIDPQLQFDQYITAQCVMSAANTFTQITIPTNVTPDDEFIINVKEIQVLVNGSVPITAFQAWAGLCLTRATKAALPDLMDPDVIARYQLTCLGGGTFSAGAAAVVESPINMAYSGRQIIAAPNVFMQMNSSGLQNALNCTIRMYYDTVPMKKQDILEILYG